MNKVKDNKGITNMTLITIVLVIIILMLLVAVVYLMKNPNTTYVTQNLPTEQSKLSSTVTETKNQYEKLKGTYEYSTENYKGYEGIYIGYSLSLKSDGTFNYNITVDNNGGFCGNYIINGSEIILNRLFGYGSDVGISSIKEEQIILKINTDGTISDSNKHDYVGSPIPQVVLTRKITEVKETLKQYLDNTIKYYDETISEKYKDQSKINKELISINDEENIYEEGEIAETILGDGNEGIYISYVVNGGSKGEFRIRDKSKLLYTKALEEKIIDIASIDYYFQRDVFILFDNGKVGKISIEDIENRNYEINIIDNISNIVRIQELYFVNEGAGIDFILIAVDKNGKTHTLDTVSD